MNVDVDVCHENVLLMTRIIIIVAVLIHFHKFMKMKSEREKKLILNYDKKNKCSFFMLHKLYKCTSIYTAWTNTKK